jgi:hypothetical protein
MMIAPYSNASTIVMLANRRSITLVIVRCPDHEKSIAQRCNAAHRC